MWIEVDRSIRSVGNAVLAAAIFGKPSLRTKSSLLLASLAVTDAVSATAGISTVRTALLLFGRRDGGG